jgi:hypothetical protein
MTGTHTNNPRRAPVGMSHNLSGTTRTTERPTVPAMARKRRNLLPGGVYEAITEEIERFLLHEDRGTQKRLASAAGIDSAAFRHRMDEYRGERFSVEELEAIRIEAGAPRGWPYVRLEEARAFEAFRKLLKASSE